MLSDSRRAFVKGLLLPLPVLLAFMASLARGVAQMPQEPYLSAGGFGLVGTFGACCVYAALTWKKNRARAKGLLLSAIGAVLLFAVLLALLVVAMSGALRG